MLPASITERLAVDPVSECWDWIGVIRHGYGITQLMAHRLVYELLVGAVPAKLDLDHLCRNRKCVNPKHLEPVTRRENLLRGNTITARCAAVTHCPQGHAYDIANTFISNRGRNGGRGRSCRACNRKRAMEHYRRNRSDPTFRAHVKALARENYAKRRKKEASR